MIEWSRLDELRTEVGDDGLAEVIGLFLEETDEVIGLLQSKDPTKLMRDLHFLNGSALNLGLRAMALQCQEGERLCSLGASETVNLAGIVEIYAESKMALSRHFGM